ncbi:uncharacterized protein LOC133194160 [Saccostrea echinata]|uniref:uncharacterized protein LOC133194160 n=1 Tax=Saccostrea echinata TaxID=191078 RepID=UPI002A7F0E5A|nr:uncharacterized protein LOC133194160 [Saccostrea echinata]
MNQKARALLRKITFLFILLGFIDYVVAYGLPHWAKYTSTDATQIHRYGLFMTCIEDFLKSECDSFHLSNVDGSWKDFVQAMASLGLFFYFVSTGTGFLQFYWEYRTKRRLLYASAGTGIVAGLLIIIAAYSFAYNNSGKQISLEYGFFMTIISIIPVVMGSLLNCFNAVLVRTSKKRKHLGSGFDIRQHMFDFSVKPPVGTHLKDLVEISEDKYEEYLRPTTRQSKKSHKKPPPNFDYFNEMLDELMDDESKQTETTTDGGSSFKKEEADDTKQNEEINESEQLEEIPQSSADVTEDVEKEDEDIESIAPPVKTGVSFNDYPVVFTDRVQKPKPAKSTRDEEKLRQSAHEMRMAQKNHRIAILRVNCKRCPFEHTITKFVEDLKTEDYPKVVKYVESAEDLSFHHLRSRCLQNMLEPIKKPSPRRLNHKEELMLKATALQGLPKIRKHRFSKMISPKGVDVEKKKKKVTNKISHIDNGRQSESMQSSKVDKELRSISQCEEDENMDKIIDEINRTMDNQSKMSSIYIDTSLKMVENANKPADVTFDEEGDISSDLPTENERAEKDDDQSRKTENENLKETIDEILNEDEVKGQIDEGAIADNEADASSEEEIIDDPGDGLGLSDNEETDTDREAQIDGVSRKTHVTQASAKTYSSENATSALYQRPLVSFDEPRVKKKKKKQVKRAKTSFPKIDMSLAGRSHKSASLTKQRRANKEQRIAIVHDRCKKCCYELSIPKYEEDLTQDEKNKVEYIIDRSKSAKS